MSTDTTDDSEKKATKPVMDVSKPGKTAPSASSRPIIVGHKAVQDTTVTEKSVDSEENLADTKITRSGPKILMPLSDNLKRDSDEHTEPKPTAEGADDAVATDESEVNESEEVIEKEVAEDVEEDKSTKTGGVDTSSSDSTDSGSAVVDAVVEQADSKKKEAKASAEEEKRQQEFEKLVQSKKYHLPIGVRTRRKRQGKGLIVLLVSLIAIVAGYAAVDKFTDMPLPYEVFKAVQNPEVEQQQDASKMPEADTVKEQVLKEAFAGEEVVSGDKSYSIKIPNGWSVELDTGGNSLKAAEPEDITYTADTKPTIAWLDGWGTDSPMRFSIYYSTESEDVATAEEGEAVTPFVTDDGLEGMRYYKQHPLEAVDGPGYLPGEKTYIYRFEKSGARASIVYRLLEKNNFSPADQLSESDPNQLELIEQVVKTFKLL